MRVLLYSVLTFGHEPRVKTEKKKRSQVQAFEMRLLQRIEEVTLFDKVRSSEIRKSLNIEQLFLEIKRIQLRLVVLNCVPRLID